MPASSVRAARARASSACTTSSDRSHIAPGQNTIEFDVNDLKPAVDGLDRRLPPGPRLRRRHGPARGRHPPAPRRLDLQLRAAVRGRARRRRSIEAAAGLRLALPPGGRVDHEPHDPQPHADGDERSTSPTTSTSSRPTRRRRPASARCARCGSTSWASQPTRSSTSTRAPGGRDRRLHLPGRGRGRGDYARNRWTVRRSDGALVGRFGHLHPGGLWTDLELTRDGRTVPLFRSEAEVLRAGRGGVLGRRDDRHADRLARRRAQGRRAVGVGHLRHDAARRGTSRWGSCRWRSTPAARGPDPFATNVNVPGEITHGPPAREPQPRRRRSPACPTRGDLLAAPRRAVALRRRCAASSTATATSGSPAAAGARRSMRPGQRLRFVNRDARRGILHTITSCRAPCNRATGIAYPLADGPVRFDSGNLGFGPPGLTPARPARSAGARRSACAPGPTRTSAACTRSCAARSASSAERASARRSRRGGRSPRRRAARRGRGGRRPRPCRA